jgi:FkbM family methyltransferase
MMSKLPKMMSLPAFGPRDRERRKAVQAPDDINAVLAGNWPPYSRDELSKFSRALRLGGLTPQNVLAGYLARRISRAVQALQNRSTRYGQTKAWSMTAPNGRKIMFPINDYSSTQFKKMVDGYDQLYEKTLIDFVTARLGPEDVFVDVGANVGYISAFAATTGASVFALEIQRDLMPLIEQMATINGFDLIRALHVGASSRSGLSMMPRIEANPGTQLEGQTGRFNRNEPRSIVDDFVPMMALDDAFLDADLLPKLVKVDVEGHEIGVLEGARRIIETGRTIFVVEFHPHLITLYRRQAEDLLKPFDPARWSMFQLTDDGLRPITGMADILPDPRDPNPKLVFEPKAA